MNTLRKYGAKYNVTFCTFAGLSTDTKPVGTTLIDNKSVGLANGSEFIEIDTDKKYFYDAENQQWNLASSGGGGGGGGSATLIEKSITENGIYNASKDSADGYSKVTVDVPNTYTAQDEGKVVDNGALVAQTAMSSEVTENGTVDTTLYNSVTVNVPSGGVEFSNSPAAFTLLSNIRNLDVIIPNGVTSIGSSAFVGCTGLTSIEIPNGVTFIGDNAFYNCEKLTSIEIPNGVTSIQQGTFTNCSNLESVNMSNTGVTVISQNAFYGCSKLTAVSLPNSLQTIASTVFRNCSSLKNIEIPYNVLSIGTSAFRDCTGLQSIKFTSTTPPTIGGSNTFQNVPTTCIIYVPTGSLSDYTSANNYPNPNTYIYEEY